MLQHWYWVRKGGFVTLYYAFFSYSALVISCCCALLGILDYYSNAAYWNDEQNTPHKPCK